MGFGGAVQAVHAGVFPFDTDGSVVADGGECAEGCFPRDVAAGRWRVIPGSNAVALVIGWAASSLIFPALQQRPTQR